MVGLRNLLSAATCCAVLCYALAAPSSSGAALDLSTLPESCYSQIYCYGDLLRVIQNAKLYPDSKTFVDMRLLYSPSETLEDFDVFMKQNNNAPTKDQIQDFVDSHFAKGDELVDADLTDWVEKPALLSRIADPQLQEFASDLNDIWKTLTRKVNDSVKENSDRYSIMYVPNNFVVPGGRFKELYYWDTYWVVRGLILSDMSKTIEGILGNFLYLLENYGIIPNGARVYYLERSQPPLLTPMVYDYYQARGNSVLDFVQENIHLLEYEFDFWMKNRTMKLEKGGKTYTLAHYYAVSKGPRPESYSEDYSDAQSFSDDTRKTEFYIDLKSAAESGWDFSSRWFVKNGTDEGELTDIHTKDIVPVDINAFVFLHADRLAKLFRALKNEEKAKYYEKIAQQWLESIQAVFWDEELGSWFDYDIVEEKLRTYFYPSNMAPLWAGSYDKSKSEHIAQKVVGYLKGVGVLDFAGGIPASLLNSGQQWDLPNAWPPLQHIIVKGLYDTQEASAVEMAFQLAQTWIASNYKAFQTSGEMFEKYDAITAGQYGGGGEYTVQNGFGWSNGVDLEFMSLFGDRLSASITSSE